MQDVCVDGAVLFSHIHTPQSTSASPTPFTQLLCKLPVLRRLSISGENSDDVLSLMLRWDTVTDLRIAPYIESNIQGFIARLVESCPSLSSLSLTIPGLPSSQQQPSYHESITYSQWNFLRTLDISFLEGYWHEFNDQFSEAVAETFQRLRTPALEHLTLNVIQHGPSRRSGYVGPTMPFHDMIVRSNSPITHLALDTFFFSNTEALSRTCESFPSLKSLKFSKDSASRWINISDEVTDDVAALNAALLCLHPPANISSTLEKLNLSGSKIGHIDSIIAFATAAPTLKDLYVEFGTMRKESVTTVMHSQHIREALAYLREVKGTRVVWKWPNDCIDYSFLDRPYAGMKNPQPTYDSL
ncbi:hypothetical protein V5O48_014142 [Marasmius crinis-equi]|uniref:Uncharacterized protein n=1 Tax=Marasmius crinis-equi TaxID=585013 RepID=A0ABR3EY31_9AGAR